MPGLLIEARIPSWRRLELQQLVAGLGEADDHDGTSPELKLYEGLDDTDHVLLVLRAASPERLAEYRHSAGYRVLLGGVRVLGALEGVQTIEEEVQAP